MEEIEAKNESIQSFWDWESFWKEVKEDEARELKWRRVDSTVVVIALVELLLLM